MKQSTFSTMIYLKHQKMNSEGEMPVNMRVTVNGRCTEIGLKRMVKVEDWDQ